MNPYNPSISISSFAPGWNKRVSDIHSLSAQDLAPQSSPAVCPCARACLGRRFSRAQPPRRRVRWRGTDGLALFVRPLVKSGRRRQARIRANKLVFSKQFESRKERAQALGRHERCDVVRVGIALAAAAKAEGRASADLHAKFPRTNKSHARFIFLLHRRSRFSCVSRIVLFVGGFFVSVFA